MVIRVPNAKLMSWPNFSILPTSGIIAWFAFANPCYGKAETEGVTNSDVECLILIEGPKRSSRVSRGG